MDLLMEIGSYVILAGVSALLSGVIVAHRTYQQGYDDGWVARGQQERERMG